MNRFDACFGTCLHALARAPGARRSACAAAAALMLSGCLSTPIEHFYTLGVASAVDASSGAAIPAAGYTLALGPVTLPELVDRPQLVVRTGANRVAILENQRWAESLKTAVARVLAANIGANLGGVTVAMRNEHAGRDARYVIWIDITRFESSQNDAVQVDAQWSVRKADGTLAQSGQSRIREATRAAGYDELVAAHERALARIGADIAQGVRTAAQNK